PIAAALCCVTDEDRAMGVAVIDLGMKHTGLALYQGSSLRGASDIDLGVDAIVADLMAVTECHEPEARTLLFEYGVAHALDGLTNNPADDGIAFVDDLPFARQQAALSPAVKLRTANREIDRATISEVIAARVDEIFNHILAPLFQEKLQRYALNRGIVLTGGGALIPKIADFVSAKYKIAVRLGRPLEIQGWLPSLQTTAYTPLAGILVHAAHYEKDRADGLLAVGEHGQPESLIAKLARWISHFT
ncbi:MAG TPA: rod shape-determining protein, partial [Candidatus Hydrogenedentes bacterium]|nr:rod shape-determining protein [Candidatus Hydrogenedentota bacterium]